MTSSGMAPLLEDYEAHLAAEADAAAGQEAQICVAPWAGTLSAAKYTPEAAVTGAATDHKTLTVRNRGADGTGATVLASLALDAGTDAAAFDETDIPLADPGLREVRAGEGDLAFAQGDVLTFQSTVTGLGMTLPEASVRIILSRS